MSSLRRVMGGAVLVASVVAASGCASEVEEGEAEPKELKEVVLYGTRANGWAGAAFDRAGDVDGDGRVDLLVGEPGDGEGAAGRVHVVTGKLDEAEMSLDEVSGFTIVGELPGDRLGAVVAGVGDVDGDGLDDVLVGTADRPYVFDGCYHDCPPGPPRVGPPRAYVVFGRSDGVDVSLADVAAGRGGGFVLDGDSPEDLVDQQVAPLGDLDLDGRADFAIAARSAAGGRGRIYVVFGRGSAAPVALSAIGDTERGFVVEGDSYGTFGFSLARAGDVNGDGLDDLVVGDASGGQLGLAYVVLGKTSTDTVRAEDLRAGRYGFVIEAEGGAGETACCTGFATDVAGGGDVDGDGLDDVVVTAPAFRADGDAFPEGRLYVISGRTETTPVQASDVARGEGGFALTGERQMGFDLGSTLEDLTGDGLADLLVADENTDLFLIEGTSAQVAPGEPVDSGDWALERSSSVGDLNDDGTADLVFSGSGYGENAGGGVVVIFR